MSKETAAIMGVDGAASYALTLLTKAATRAEYYATSGYHGSADADVYAVSEKLATVVALLTDVLGEEVAQ
jgi:hypothetical protein